MSDVPFKLGRVTAPYRCLTPHSSRGENSHASINTVSITACYQCGSHSMVVTVSGKVQEVSLFRLHHITTAFGLLQDCGHTHSSHSVA